MIFDELDTLEAAKTKIKVIGVGGAGKNAIDHMIENAVHGVEFFAVNTDAQDLKVSKADNKLLIGKTKTHGQGAGANPDVGRAAALEGEDDIHEMIGDAEMVFITCGMGGGTGTGAAPVIARIAREHGCLTVGICTKPFQFEGPTRMNNAVAGLEELRQYVDTLIVIPNQRLLQIVDVHTSVLAAFREADNVLRKGVQGIAEIIAIPGLINVDFADVRAVMANKGTALMGIGAAKGENRAVEAARHAIHSALLEVTIDGATDAIVNITASQELSLKEVDVAIAEIRNNCGKDLNIIYGTAINNDLKDELVITVVATGYELKAQSSGYDDLAETIYRNMSDENIVYSGISSIDDEDDDLYAESDLDSQEQRVSEIFDTVGSKKEEKRRLKYEARQRKLENKAQKKETAKKPQAANNNSLPDWLTRQ
ncbi:MAG: cell division protein FtsZ [Acholeplasmatales bacterium]|nr:cell division protein FtsZ [Acholeplasmatales bacterium]